MSSSPRSRSSRPAAPGRSRARGTTTRRADSRRTATSRRRGHASARASGSARERSTARATSHVAPRTGERQAASRRSVARRAAADGPQRPVTLRALLLSPVGVVVAAFVATVLVGVGALSGWGAVVRQGAGSTRNAQASTGGPAAVVPDTTGFDANRIIDDDVFYDSSAMTLSEVEAFIAKVNEGCVTGADGTVCLAQATFDTQDREATDTCPNGYEGDTGETAAQVISKVATACEINPQVLLVLIQKEQGLLTASGEQLVARDYEAAAGYACPDGASCDAAYAGFFAQLYGAANQFQLYRLDPGTYQVSKGVTAQIAFSPDPACGSAQVTPTTQATAGLYNYTPYQPNEATASGGDACSSWGNWNFYGYFQTFFGDPTPDKEG